MPGVWGQLQSFLKTGRVPGGLGSGVGGFQWSCGGGSGPVHTEARAAPGQIEGRIPDTCTPRPRRHLCGTTWKTDEGSGRALPGSW